MKTDIKNLWLWGHVINPLLHEQWLFRLNHFNQLIVGFSGGLDSTVLLHVLASYPLLRAKLLAVHVNHGINSRAHAWQTHCEQFCLNSSIPFITHSVQLDASANLEERARIARYAVFSALIKEQDCLVLGHHLDDQAETLLLQLFRGAGVDGLSAMSELSSLSAGTLARPFLTCSRERLEDYAALYQLSWIEDDSNQDIHYSRNYLRHQIIPVLKTKWPGVVSNIARTAIHCQQAKENLEVLAIQDYPELMSAKNSLFIEPLLELNSARIINILRLWIKNNQIPWPSTSTLQRLVHEVIFASPDALPEVTWGDYIVQRYQQYLYLDKKKSSPLCSAMEWSEFPLPLILGDTGMQLRAKKAAQGLVIPRNAKISIRFRQGGEEIVWHGQTKRLKKLFQQWNILPWLRERMPLIYIGDELAAVPGYAVSDLFFAKGSAHAWSLWIYTARSIVSC